MKQRDIILLAVAYWYFTRKETATAGVGDSLFDSMMKRYQQRRGADGVSDKRRRPQPRGSFTPSNTPPPPSRDSRDPGRGQPDPVPDQQPVPQYQQWATNPQQPAYDQQQYGPVYDDGYDDDGGDDDDGGGDVVPIRRDHRR